MGTIFEKMSNHSEKCATPNMRLVDRFRWLSYSERLRKLNLPSLVYRSAQDDR